MSLWTSRQFRVLDQTNPIAENFYSDLSSAVLVFFITSIKYIKPKKIHRGTSEVSKFVAIEQGYKIHFSFLCVTELKFFDI